MKKVVILGTGFAALTFIKKIDLRHYRLTVISPRNHFVFTPLLPSSTVGTVEFRSIIEPIRTAKKNIEFFQAHATRLDAEAKTLTCENAADKKTFTVSYDKLLVAVGATNNTFGIEGVKEHALFLKEVSDARLIRQRIIDNFERAALPTLDADERKRLLHFVVVGGGPTGVEYAAELADFLEDELHSTYPHLASSAKVTLVEAGKQILNSFDAKLSAYATQTFQRRKISVLTNSPVKKVTAGKLCLTDGTEIEYGLLVWSTGNAATGFADAAPLQKDKTKRLIIDAYFRAAGHQDIFALGDCATVEAQVIPATAQSAMQQGKYLGKLFNKIASSRLPDAAPERVYQPFVYKHLGMLAYIGDDKALADLPVAKTSGFLTWLFWRSAYLTRLVSWKNKAQVLFDWIKAAIFGRDVSRF